ncbi:MAG: hypothetical protein IKR23_09830 [Lachnospiraceae bacterium]|nr:hypothetical protein [Lachnospiraceae bacterium]
MYTNVKKGLEQLWLSQILEIVVAVAGVLTTIFAAATLVLAFVSGGLAALTGVLTGLFGVITAIGAIAGFILGLLGILSASQDEPSYKNALVWLVIGIVASLLTSLIGNRDKFIWKLLKAILGAANGFAGFMVMYTVLNATVTVANAVGNFEVASQGMAKAELFKKLYIIAIILVFVGFIPVIGGLCALVGAIMELVIFFMYLGFLGKAKMMV